jgi:hypothetical protein
MSQMTWDRSSNFPPLLPKDRTMARGSLNQLRGSRYPSNGMGLCGCTDLSLRASSMNHSQLFGDVESRTKSSTSSQHSTSRTAARPLRTTAPGRRVVLIETEHGPRHDERHLWFVGHDWSSVRA